MNGLSICLVIGAFLGICGGATIVNAQHAPAQRTVATPIPVQGSIEAQMPYEVAACGNKFGPTLTLAPGIMGAGARVASFETCAILEVNGQLYSLPHFGPTSVQS